MRRAYSKNNLFLMEILLNILLFTVLLVVSVSFFSKTHALTRKATQLQHAMRCSCDLAAIFEAGDGTTSDILTLYPYSVNLDQKVIVYLDDKFKECKKEQAQYFLSAQLDEHSSDSFQILNISCQDLNRKVLYEQDACHYTPLQAGIDMRIKGVE